MTEPTLYVKICGVTLVDDALFAVEHGATALGLNFVPSSKRRVDPDAALRIADAVRGKVELVAVVADASPAELSHLRDAVGVDYLQLHGDESPEALSAVLPVAFKAVRIGAAEDAATAARFGGERLLADAKVDGTLGGTGAVFDWALVEGLARTRRLILAGGLTPDNVAAAVRAVRPWGVDVATGVERAPGVKDPERVRAFIRAAREAAR